MNTVQYKTIGKTGLLKYIMKLSSVLTENSDSWGNQFYKLFKGAVPQKLVLQGYLKGLCPKNQFCKVI